MTTDSLYLYIPNLILSAETQVMFNEATQKNCKISFDEWYLKIRLLSDLLVQQEVGSAQQENSPKYMISVHQIRLRANTSHKKINIAIFDNLDLRKYYVEIAGQRYPRDSVLINYEKNDFIQEYKTLKLFFKGYIGEPFLNPPIISRHENKIPY